MTLSFRATLTGDQMSGQVQFGSFGEGSFLAERARGQEWLPDEHLAYFRRGGPLDMSDTARYERERRGGPPYHPRKVLRLLRGGVVLSRIAQRLHDRLQGVGGEHTPDFRTISDFRKDNLDALSGLFIQVLALCQQSGLVKLGHVALDGTTRPTHRSIRR